VADIGDIFPHFDAIAVFVSLLNMHVYTHEYMHTCMCLHMYRIHREVWVAGGDRLFRCVSARTRRSCVPVLLFVFMYVCVCVAILVRSYDPASCVYMYVHVYVDVYVYVQT
jgi:hypothetical protein